MLGKGVQREYEKDAGPFQDDAGMTWHLDNTSPSAPPLSESLPRFLSRMPGAVSRCTRKQNHLLLLDSLVRRTVGKRRGLKPHHNKRFLSPRTPPPLLGAGDDCLEQ